MRGATVEVTCACGCGQKFTARVADRKRGWGRFASKSCKATYQEHRTGQMRRYLQRQYGGVSADFEADADRESIQFEAS